MTGQNRRYSIDWLNTAISEIKRQQHLTEEGISARLGYNEGYISQTRSRGFVPDKFAKALEREFGVRVAPDEPGSVVREQPASYSETRLKLKNGDHQKKVPVYGGFTTLGNIEVIDDEGLRNRVVAELPADVFPGCDYAEKAKGDSMYPLIMNQALLIGKQCSVKGISYGEKYIIKTKDGLDTTKFVHPGSVPESIKLKAYNKSIPDQEVPLADITFACRVYWIVNPT